MKRSLLGLAAIAILVMAGLSVLAIARNSPNPATSFTHITLGQRKASVLTEMPPPCLVGNLGAAAGSILLSDGARYAVWSTSSQYELVVFSQLSSASGYGGSFGAIYANAPAVIGKFTAPRRSSSSDYCAVGVTSDPFTNSSWTVRQ